MRPFMILSRCLDFLFSPHFPAAVPSGLVISGDFSEGVPDQDVRSGIIGCTHQLFLFEELLSGHPFFALRMRNSRIFLSLGYVSLLFLSSPLLAGAAHEKQDILQRANSLQREPERMMEKSF